MQAKVQILLATYNGEQFLQQQIESLLQQTYTDFTILIRDDGSTDKTLEIIESYQQKYPAKFILLKEDKMNVGATQNFGILLAHSTADYIFFCDQDDVWMPSKIEHSLSAIFTMENEQKSNPCLVYSDMKLINEHGIIIADSVWKQLHLSPDYFTLNRLLVQNIPHGCTVLINKAMKSIASPIPATAILHDHWLALLAASVGNSVAITTPLILLRNHTQNVTRKNFSFAEKIKRYFKNLSDKNAYEQYLKIRIAQAKALMEKCSLQLNNDQIRLLQDFIALENMGSMQRKKIFIKNQFYRTTFLHSLKMILRA